MTSDRVRAYHPHSVHKAVQFVLAENAILRSLFTAGSKEQPCRRVRPDRAMDAEAKHLIENGRGPTSHHGCTAGHDRIQALDDLARADSTGVAILPIGEGVFQ